MELFAVYQDCIFCKEKGKKELKLLENEKITVIKTSFASERGLKLTPKALKSGINTFPFYTDGEEFFTSAKEVVEYKNKKEQGVKKENEDNRLHTRTKTTKKATSKRKKSTRGNARAKKSD